MLLAGRLLRVLCGAVRCGAVLCCTARGTETCYCVLCCYASSKFLCVARCGGACGPGGLVLCVLLSARAIVDARSRL